MLLFVALNYVPLYVIFGFKAKSVQIYYLQKHFNNEDFFEKIALDKIDDASIRFNCCFSGKNRCLRDIIT